MEIKFNEELINQDGSKEWCIVFNHCSVAELPKVKEELAKHLYNVELEGLEHNFYAWAEDYKSGWRGKECFIFTPCGCNPLTFRVSYLKENDESHTYEA